MRKISCAIRRRLFHGEEQVVNVREEPAGAALHDEINEPRGGAGVGLRGAEAGLELGEGEAGRGGGGRGDGAGIAFGPGDELFLEGEGGAGEAHDRDGEAGDEAGDEVEPEEGFAEGCHGAEGGG